MRFVRDYPVEGLRGADYNPRAIDAEAEQALDASMTTLGCAKPVIAREDGLTVAGHQRTKSARRLGWATLPAWVLADITKADEIRFNQLHNGTDLDLIDHPVFIPVDASSAGVFVDVPPERIVGNLRSTGAVLRDEICDLIAKYGPWGAAVIDSTGEVVNAPQYALACSLLGIPCRVYRVPDGTDAFARAAFGRRYGEFSYAHLEREPWRQTYAQPFRLRAQGFRSVLYEKHVLPQLRPGERLLDFGCGQADYLAQLRRRGHAAFGVEFFYRTGNAIDVGWVHREMDATLRELRERGRFDVVVCDSVLNSVVTKEAGDDVLAVILALTRPGGRVHVAGRRKEQADTRLRANVKTNRIRRVEFLDPDGFSAIWRRDGWSFQRFISDADRDKLIAEWFGTAEQTIVSDTWQFTAVKGADPPPEVVEAALRREFDLPWPDGHSVGRADAAVEAWRAAISAER